MTSKAKLCISGASFHAATNIHPCEVETEAEIVAGYV